VHPKQLVGSFAAHISLSDSAAATFSIDEAFPEKGFC